MSVTDPWTTHRLLHTGFAAHAEIAAHKALRTRSPAAVDALALFSTSGKFSSSELKTYVLKHGRPPAASLRGDHLPALIATAMVWAGTDGSAEDLQAAAIVVEHLFAGDTPPPLSPPQQLFVAQTLFLSGRHTALVGLLPSLPDLNPSSHHYLVTDLANPYGETVTTSDPGSPAADHAAWEGLLSRAFVKHGLSGLSVVPAVEAGQSPFDRLDVPTALSASVSGELVTVVMPCYQPDRGLLTAVRSIGAQTWSDLDIVIVDDASGPDYADLFAEAAALDPRARLLTMERNGGSYLAREAAIEQSTGSLITFQDADDWSHPSRIEHQVHALGDGAPMSRSQAVRARDDLTHQWLGSAPVRENASSLLVRRSVVETYGGFIPVRKGADSEFADRITLLAGPIADTQTPLAVTRLRQGSLSRGDFMRSWTTPERTWFRGSFQAWHRDLKAAVAIDPSLHITTADLHRLPFAVPLPWVRSLSGEEVTPSRLDRAYVGNFSPVEPSPHADRLRRRFAKQSPTAGTTGLWHLEPPWTRTLTRPKMSRAWMNLIHRTPGMRPLCRVEPMHVDRLIVVDPDVLSLVGGHECRVTASQVEVRLSPEHLLVDDSGLPLDLLGISDQCLQWWGVRPQWTFAPGIDAAGRSAMAQSMPRMSIKASVNP